MSSAAGDRAKTQQATEAKEAVGGLDSQQPADASAVDRSEMAADTLNPMVRPALLWVLR
jgi:hypothetical protein